MKKLLLGLTALTLIPTLAFAQAPIPTANDTIKITRSSGSYADVNLFSAAQLAVGITVSGPPVPTGTGTPTITTGSTDTSGEVTAGASATSVIITFSSAKTNAPFCTVNSQTQLAAFAYTVSTTAITITQTATSGNKIDYWCPQH